MSLRMNALRTMVLASALLGVLALGSNQAQGATAKAAEPPLPATVDEALKGTLAYEFGQSRVALSGLGEFVRLAAPDAAKKAALAKQLVAALQGPGTKDGKHFLCRQLALIGGAEAVPALGALLPDADMSDMARYALERIEDPAAEAALRDALPKTKGKMLVGVINSLGERRDRSAVASVIPLLSDADPVVAGSAAAALGKMGGPDAAKALAAAIAKAGDALKPIATDAYLACADGLLAEKKDAEAAAIYNAVYVAPDKGPTKLAALRGLILSSGAEAAAIVIDALKSPDTQIKALALRAIQDDKTGTVAAALAGKLNAVPPEVQAQVLDALAVKPEVTGVQPAIVAAAKSPEPAVRAAALRALGTHGDASALPLLTAALAGAAGPEQDAARESLKKLKGAEVNAKLLADLNKADAKLAPELIKVLAARGATAALPDLMKLTTHEDQAVRTEAYAALGALAGDSDVPAMVKLLVEAKTDADRTAAENAVQALIPRLKDRQELAKAAVGALAGAAPAAKASLLKTLGRTGGAGALAAVIAARGDGDPVVSEAAFRALSEWPDLAAAPELMNLAKMSPDAKQQVLALRGVVRLAGVETNANNKLTMLRDAMAAAKRPDEKKLVLAALPDTKVAAAFALIEPCLTDPALTNEACLAAVNLAKAVPAADKPAAKAFLQKVLDANKDKAIQKAATDALKGM